MCCCYRYVTLGCWYYAGFAWFLLCVDVVAYQLAYLLLVFVWFFVGWWFVLRLYVNSVVTFTLCVKCLVAWLGYCLV